MPTKVPIYWKGHVAYWAMVDDEDAERVLAHTWRYQTNGNSVYAKGRPGLLHRFVVSAPKGSIVDHRNGDTLDCTRANLRFATPSESTGNTQKTDSATSSRFKGVYWDNTKRRWKATIHEQGEKIELGHYRIETDAAYAYDDAARERWGAFACVNFPRPGERAATDLLIPYPPRSPPKPKRGLPTGVYRYKGMRRYGAHIISDRVRHRLGLYDTIAEAEAAYIAAKRAQNVVSF